MSECIYVGDRVHKTKGDYTFEGEVVAVFTKRATSPFVPGPMRYVVEDDRGLLFIFSESQLEHVP